MGERERENRERGREGESRRQRPSVHWEESCEREEIIVACDAALSMDSVGSLVRTAGSRPQCNGGRRRGVGGVPDVRRSTVASIRQSSALRENARKTSTNRN